MGYTIVAGVTYAFVFLLIGVVQNVVRFFLEKKLSFLNRTSADRGAILKNFSWHFHYLFLHPYRRIAWIVLPLKEERVLRQFVVEQREKRLSEIDNRHIENFWITMKTVAWFSLLAAWFLSLWKFYQYVVPIVNGGGNLNSIGLYFSSSFRIFVHTAISAIFIVVFGLLGKKIWILHLFHLDEAIFDEIICKIEKEKDQTERILKILKEAFLKLENRISNLERMLVKRKLTNAT